MPHPYYCNNIETTDRNRVFTISLLKLGWTHARPWKQKQKHWSEHTGKNIRGILSYLASDS